MHERLITELARLFSTAPENVDLFGVVDNDDGGVDVRYAAHGSPYYEAEKMDGIVAQNVQQVSCGEGTVRCVEVDCELWEAVDCGMFLSE